MMRNLNKLMLGGKVIIPEEGLQLVEIVKADNSTTVKLILRIRNLNGKPKAANEQYAPADFYTVEVWGTTAEWAAANLYNGDYVNITGHLSTYSYQKEDKSRVYGIAIICDDLERVTDHFEQNQNAGNASQKQPSVNQNGSGYQSQPPAGQTRQPAQTPEPPRPTGSGYPSRQSAGQSRGTGQKQAPVHAPAYVPQYGRGGNGNGNGNPPQGGSFMPTPKGDFMD